MFKSTIYKVTGLILGLTTVLVSFQNCNNVKFAQVPDNLSLSSLSVPVQPGVCQAPDVACETDRYIGRQVCDNSANGPVYGVCVFQACKPPFALINGMCQTPVCQNGDKKSCEYQDPVSNLSATGLRICDNNGWGTCNWIKISVGGLSAVSLNAEKTYVFEVRTSDPSIHIDQSSLKFVSGSCKGGNANPWILGDLPLAVGTNSLLYKGTVVDNMSGCVWNGEVQSNISGVSSSIVITASTPVPSTCANGATNPPLCTTMPVCTNGATNYPLCTTMPVCANGATNYPTCTTFAPCTNGATNPPLCTTMAACTNGATNYPACNMCPATKPNLVNNVCVANCANSANNPPTCTTFTACANGANNPPTCTTFPPCTNGATNPPLCTSIPTCLNGATNYPACTSCPSARPNFVDGQCYVNCANGGINPPTCTPPVCANGANNPPTCTTYNPCANFASNPPTCTTCPAIKPNMVNNVCVASCTNGATNPPTCTQIPVCVNGATNYPTCNSCPVSIPNYVNGTCIANCTNGGTNPPTCTAPTCANGATNYPTCTSCPSSKPNFVNGQCYASCTNGGTNPPTCTAPTCANGATNYPTCNSCPASTPNYVNGQCYANCANGGTNPPTCTAPTCSNGATNYPTCTSCPAAKPNFVNGQCYASCTNGGTNPPTCTAPTCSNGATNYPSCNSCPASAPNLVGGQCYANCTNGGTNPPTCTAPVCSNSATNYPSCTSCPSTKPNYVGGQCYANCTNGGTNPPTCTAPVCSNGATNYPSCNSCPANAPNYSNGQCYASCANTASNPPSCTSCPANAPNYVNGQCFANCANGGTNPPSCTSCAAPAAYNPGSGQCQTQCQPFTSPALCRITEVCPDGHVASDSANGYTPQTTFIASGFPGETKQALMSNISMQLASNESLVLWNQDPSGGPQILAFTCSASSAWTQTHDGYCQVKRVLGSDSSLCRHENPTTNYCGSWDGKAVSATRLVKQEGNLKFYTGTSGAAADTVSCLGVWDTISGTWVRSRFCKYANKRECQNGNLSSTRAYDDYNACPDGYADGGDGCYDPNQPIYIPPDPQDGGGA